jgi:hypothetical protein
VLLLDLVRSRCLSHGHLKEILCHGSCCNHGAWEHEQKNESLVVLAQWRKCDAQSSSHGQEDGHIIHPRKKDPTELLQR